jgi:hypothetical protein
MISIVHNFTGKLTVITVAEDTTNSKYLKGLAHSDNGIGCYFTCPNTELNQSIVQPETVAYCTGDFRMGDEVGTLEIYLAQIDPISVPAAPTPKASAKTSKSGKPSKANPVVAVEEEQIPF